jgi:hypothetical protein
MEFNQVHNRMKEEIDKLTQMIDRFIEKNYVSTTISGDDAQGLYYMVISRKILMEEAYELRKEGRGK